MSKYYKIRITQGYSSCATGFNIYWNTINPNNLAQVYHGQGQPLTSASNIPYSQLTTQPPGSEFTISVDNSATQILLYDTCNQCQTLILPTPP